LGGQAQNPITAMQTFINLLIWGLVAVGATGIGVGITKVMRGGGWGSWMVGGILALGFSGVIALANNIINGQPPTLPGW
jgi:hypothetical protein